MDEKYGTSAGDALAFGQYFPNPLGRSLPHSLALERNHILAAGHLRSLFREGCFLDYSLGGVARAAM